MGEEPHMAQAATTTIQLGPIRIDFLVTADDSDGSLTMFECLIPVGSRVPVPHSHDGFEETNYVLEGACTWTIDGQERELGRDPASHGVADHADPVQPELGEQRGDVLFYRAR